MRNKSVAAFGAALLVVLGSVAFTFGGHKDFTEVDLAPTGLAGNAGLQNATGQAMLKIDKGLVIIFVDLGDASLPAGSVLEGWVVDPGHAGGPGGPALTSESSADEVYGTPFGDPVLDGLADDGAYALSTGVLKKVGNNKYMGKFQIDNSLVPYNAVVITIESDGNVGNYDPRPGTPMLVGEY